MHRPPEDIWYIIPAAEAHGRKLIRLYPGLPTRDREHYREAWHLLREAARMSEETDVCGDDASNDDPTNTSETAPRLPRNAMERVQAAMRFAKAQPERGGARLEKRSEEV